MPEPSPLPASVVARLSTDQATALAIGDALTDSFEAEEVAAAWSEQPDGRWSLAVHFRDPPNETAVRALVAIAAGAHAANALAFERLAAKDWVRGSLEGLTPVGPAASSCTARMTAPASPATASPSRSRRRSPSAPATTAPPRGCLLALDRLVKRAAAPRPRARRRHRHRRARHRGGARAAHRRCWRATSIPRRDGRARECAAQPRRRRVEVVARGGLAARRFRERAPFDLVLRQYPARAAEAARHADGTVSSRRGGSVVLSGLLRAGECVVSRPTVPGVSAWSGASRSKAG